MCPSFHLHICPFTLCTCLHHTFFITTCTTTGSKSFIFYSFSIHLIYTFVSLYVLHDTFFTTTCTTTVCKYFCFYACVHPLHLHICPFALCTYFFSLHHTFFITTCTTTGSKSFIFYSFSIHFIYTFVSLYVLHDTFFTTTCTTTVSK